MMIKEAAKTWEEYNSQPPKQCYTCKKEKPIREFYYYQAAAGLLPYSSCKSCHANNVDKARKARAKRLKLAKAQANG